MKNECCFIYCVYDIYFKVMKCNALSGNSISVAADQRPNRGKYLSRAPLTPGWMHTQWVLPLRLSSCVYFHIGKTFYTVEIMAGYNQTLKYNDLIPTTPIIVRRDVCYNLFFFSWLFKYIFMHRTTTLLPWLVLLWWRYFTGLCRCEDGTK